MVSCPGVKKRLDLVVPGRIEALDADGQVVTSYTGMMLDPQLELAVLGL